LPCGLAKKGVALEQTLKKGVVGYCIYAITNMKSYLLLFEVFLILTASAFKNAGFLSRKIQIHQSIVILHASNHQVANRFSRYSLMIILEKFFHNFRIIHVIHNL